MNKLDQKLGFIGAGNMARAILKGTIASGLIQPQQAIASDALPTQVDDLVSQTGARAAASNVEVVSAADVIIFATKPYQVAEVCAEIREHIRPGQLFVSICAGVRTGKIEQALNPGARVVRVMPNTPALIGCGSAAISPGQHADPADLEIVKAIFDSVGTSVVVQEEKLDLVTGLTGSGPAYVFRFMEALLEAATDLGLSEAEAKSLVPQMVLGSVRMAIESGKPLPELRQNVTTRGGTTEAGLKVLEEGDFSQLIQDCVEAATRRSRELAS
ncbi:MAG: pyrroline-5-carboxylate reductase [Candidatus Sumerlaeaceae bacterium]